MDYAKATDQDIRDKLMEFHRSENMSEYEKISAAYTFGVAVGHCKLREKLSSSIPSADLLAAAQLLDDCLIRIYPEEFAPEHRKATAQRFFDGRGTISRIATMADKLRQAATTEIQGIVRDNDGQGGITRTRLFASEWRKDKHDNTNAAVQ